MATYFSVSKEWTTFGWVFIVFGLVTMPIIMYHLYLYFLHRNLTFFRSRMANATIWLILWQNLMYIHRIFDVLIAMGYIANSWEIGRLIGYLEIFPFFCLYFYKYVENPNICI